MTSELNTSQESLGVNRLEEMVLRDRHPLDESDMDAEEGEIVNSPVHNGPEMPKIGQKSGLASHDRILMFEVSIPMFFGTRNLNLALFFMYEHYVRAHERARTQKAL